MRLLTYDVKKRYNILTMQVNFVYGNKKFGIKLIGVYSNNRFAKTNLNDDTSAEVYRKSGYIPLMRDLIDFYKKEKNITKIIPQTS